MIQNNAQNLAAQPYPVYQAPLQAGLTPQQLQAFTAVQNAASAPSTYNANAATDLQNASSDQTSAYDTQNAALGTVANDITHQSTAQGQVNQGINPQYAGMALTGAGAQARVWGLTKSVRAWGKNTSGPTPSVRA